jgi:hypothetical protein
MEHRTKWLTDDKSILLVEFIDAWTWDELHDVMQEITLVVKDTTHPIHLILKFEVHPPPGNPVNQFNDLARNRPKNIIDIFMAIPSLPSVAKVFLGSLAGLLDKMAGRKEPITIVYSIEEARALIEKQAVRS